MEMKIARSLMYHDEAKAALDTVIDVLRYQENAGLTHAQRNGLAGYIQFKVLQAQGHLVMSKLALHSPEIDTPSDHMPATGTRNHPAIVPSRPLKLAFRAVL